MTKTYFRVYVSDEERKAITGAAKKLAAAGYDIADPKKSDGRLSDSAAIKLLVQLYLEGVEPKQPSGA